MSNTYTQLFVHIVFSSKHREKVLTRDIREQIFKYITGVIEKRNQKLYIIGGYLDHIHIFLSLSPTIQIDALVRDIKQSSSKFINDNKLTDGIFRWQEGYGAFSNSVKDIDRVITYIKHQEEHHAKKTFIDEYVSFLNVNKIDYDEKYI
ncbi:MAG: IS200/IS605 family transposase [bacterium]